MLLLERAPRQRVLFITVSYERFGASRSFIRGWRFGRDVGRGWRDARDDVEVFTYRRFTLPQYAVVFVLILVGWLVLLAYMEVPGPVISNAPGGWWRWGAFWILPFMVIVAVTFAYSHGYSVRIFPQGIKRGRLQVSWAEVVGVEEGSLSNPRGGAPWRFVDVSYVRGGQRQRLRVTTPINNQWGAPFAERVRERWTEWRAGRPVEASP